MKFLVRLVLSFLIVAPVFAKDQQEFLEIKTRYGFKIKRRQPLNFNLFLSSDSSGSKPVLFAAVALQNDILQFKKEGENYLARYRISIAVRDESTSLLQFSQEHDLTLSTFKRTNSTFEQQQHVYRLDKWTPNLKLTQGKYNCLLEVEDLNTKKTTHKNLLLHLTKKFSERASSPICFLSADPDSSNTLSLSPHLNSLDFNQSYFAYAQFKKTPDSLAQIQLQIKQKNALVLDTLIATRALSNKLVQAIFPLPQDKLSEGDYQIQLKYGEVIQKRGFSIVWFRKPVYLYKVDLALRPMRYLLSEKELEFAHDLKQSDLEKWFNDYWRKRDPSPKTVYNELMFEFFQRVSESNHKFKSRAKEGWETDRGQVFILYGPPGKIENGRFASQSLPYLVWEYGDSLRFVFVDPRRNGEFVLQNKDEKD